MEKPPQPEPQYERNEQRKHDIKFLRAFLRSMDQTRVMRWRNPEEERFRSPEDVKSMTESVAEHVGQMLSLITYIQLKAEVEGDQTITELDLSRVNTMVCLHDMSENIVGDTKIKDDTYYKAEEVAHEQIREELGELNFGSKLKGYIEDYNAKASAEAHFVKAIDEIQAMLYMIYARGFSHSNRDYDNQDEIKGLVYAKEFPTLSRISDILVRIITNPKSINSDVPEMALLQEQYKEEGQSLSDVRNF